MVGIPARTEPLDAVRSLAESAANERGVSLIGAGLRLFDGPWKPSSTAAGQDSSAKTSPFALGRTYELLLTATARRNKGAHLTPETIARHLVEMMSAPTPSDRVLDPSVGGAAFLLAVADQLVQAGAAPAAVVDQLHGFDIDDGAVATAEAAVALWAIDHGLDPRPYPQLQHGDGLLRELPKVERVVGNPPFLNQLRSSSSHSTARRASLRDRWGDLVGTYTDDAWLFLAAGLDTLTDDGALAMVQPVSILSARHGAAVREYVHEHARLTGLWLAGEQVFDAAVQVCGVVVGKGMASKTSSVKRAAGADFAAVPALRRQPSATEWGSLAAAAMNVPDIRLPASPSGTVGDFADATAGFRDQFYGFVPYVSDGAINVRGPKLVTVGMIDVLRLGWGEREFKFAKNPFVRPVIDLDALNAGDPALGEWVASRQQPKLLMATQTKVVEVWVDEPGDAIPATPVLSIEPRASDLDALWRLAAALSSPAVSAHLLAANFGSALSLNAMKVAARDVLAVPLPLNTQPWDEAAELVRNEPEQLERFGQLMGHAYGIDDAALVSWWLDRVPNRPSR